MFDLPSVTPAELKEYRNFRRFLLKNGFFMMQESIYSKIVLNKDAADSVSENIRKNKPKNGLVQLLIITEKQYSNMEYIIGEGQKEFVDSDERLVIL